MDISEMRELSWELGVGSWECGAALVAAKSDVLPIYCLEEKLGRTGK